MLDSGNYNTAPVAITKSVTILATPGVLGSVVAIGGNAINVTTGGRVTLRNLSIVPFPGNTDHGIVVSNSATLSLENCKISGFTGGTGRRALSVTAAARVSIANSTLSGNGFGVRAGNAARVFASDSHFDNNENTGILLDGSSTLATRALVVRSTANNNQGSGLATNIAANSEKA